MIYGGSNGSLQSGNIRSGYSDLFVPAKISLIPASILSAYNSNQDLKYTFKVYVYDETLAEWVYLSAAISFQISLNPTGNYNTASLSVGDTQTWAINGTEHTNLLKPGNTKIKITGSCTGISEFAFFTGRLTGYNRSEAYESAVINLQCADVRSLLQRLSGESYTSEQTSYRNIKRQIKSELQGYGVTFGMMSDDTSGTFNTTGSKYSEVDKSVNGQSAWLITSAGNLVVSSTNTGENASVSVGDMLRITDSNIITADREYNDNTTYNSVKIAGYSGGVYTLDSVVDAADVALRGNVWYAPGIIGTPTCQLTESEAIAQKMLDAQNNPKFNLTVPFFPFFEVGQAVYMQSDIFNIPASTANLASIQHSYQQGQAVTTLNDVYAEEV